MTAGSRSGRRFNNIFAIQSRWFSLNLSISASLSTLPSIPEIELGISFIITIKSSSVISPNSNIFVIACVVCSSVAGLSLRPAKYFWKNPRLAFSSNFSLIFSKRVLSSLVTSPAICTVVDNISAWDVNNRSAKALSSWLPFCNVSSVVLLALATVSFNFTSFSINCVLSNSKTLS